MAILLGGSVLVTTTLATTRIPPAPSVSRLPEIVVGYEWLAWLGLGVLVMTGVGNLGAFGMALPGPQTAWGLKLTIKLVLVIVLLLGSMLRTLLVVHLSNDERDSLSAAALTTMRVLYAATTGLATLVLFVAVALAHG
jgi:hypothetical protein